MPDQNPAQIYALGEIAIRCNDIAPMRSFYRDIVGLSILRDFSDTSGIVFFRIAEGHGGHTSILALFGENTGQPPDLSTTADPPETGARSSLHHIALTVNRDAQDALRTFLDSKGIPHRTQDFPWIGWRGVFITDPEGNTVEFVAGVR